MQIDICQSANAIYQIQSRHWRIDWSIIDCCDQLINLVSQLGCCGLCDHLKTAPVIGGSFVYVLISDGSLVIISLCVWNT